MDAVINVGNKPEAIRRLNHYAERDRGHFDVRFRNVHLCKLNKIADRTLFRKNDLYVDASTLYELMLPVGGQGSHHYHGLRPSEIVESLNRLDRPDLICKSYLDRLVLGVHIKKPSERLLAMVIDPSASKKYDVLEKINKLITIVPKDNLHGLLRGKDRADILYLANPKMLGDG